MAVTLAAPESDIISGYPIDLCFDLDLVLTMTAESSSGISVSESLVSNMPTVSVDDDVCSTCMEEFQKIAGGDGKQMPCGHVYHAPCISTWLPLYNSCPLCRHCISGEN